MKASTLGLILIVIGLIGGVLAYSSVLYFHDPIYFKVGLASNVIQIFGLVLTW